MKTDYGWLDGGKGTNSSGFSGLPGGNRSNSGNFIGGGYYGSWWSSSQYNLLSWTRWLTAGSYGDSFVFSNIENPRYGQSVRCVRDAE